SSRGDFASMGPPLFRGGHNPLQHLQDGLLWASMGPPLFRGGHAAMVFPVPTGPLLQWGHLSLEVVIHRAALQPAHVPLASMGPPLFRGGHYPPAAWSRPKPRASMGPPLFRGGHDSGS